MLVFWCTHHCYLAPSVFIAPCCPPGCACGEACTVVIRGATQQILDEAERSLHDALCVLSQTVKETRTVCGGGEDNGRKAGLCLGCRYWGGRDCSA